MKEDQDITTTWSPPYHLSAKEARASWRRLQDRLKRERREAQEAEDRAEDRAEAHEGETLAEQSYDPETNTVDPFGSLLEEDEGPPET